MALADEIRARVAQQAREDEALRVATINRTLQGLAAGDSSGLARRAIDEAALAANNRGVGRGYSAADFAGRADTAQGAYLPGISNAAALALGQQKEVLDYQRLMNTKEDEARALRDYMAALGDRPQIGSGGGGGGGGRRRGGGGGEPAPAAPAAAPRSGVSSTLATILAGLRGGGAPMPVRRTPTAPRTPALPRAPRRPTVPSRTSTTRYS